MQRRVCKIILENEYSDLENARRRLNILSFDQSLFLTKAKTMYRVFNNMVFQYIKDIYFQFRAVTLPATSLRSVSNQYFAIPKPKIILYEESLSYSGPVIWNAIPSELKNSSSLNVFTKLLTGLQVCNVFTVYF